MGWLRKKKIQKRLSFILLAILVVQGGFFLVADVHADNPGMAPEGAYAAGVGPYEQTKDLGGKDASATSQTPAAPPVVTPGTCSWYEVGCQIRQLIIELLGMFLSFLFRFVMIPAATGFAWTVDPATMTGTSGTLNLPAVYNLWQFIRDFFNLFFILILLFSAFATIFQVDSFNIRNIFKNILLVALFINFSFPITRFLIDAANVPMYYFINDVLGDGKSSGGMIAMQSMFAYSGTGATAFTNVREGDMAPLIMGIIFVFLFSISLFVLALMMIIRLIALTMLLIFSPIGFAASLLPGLDKFGREWWENFWKYALFGPSAALMLMISIKFMAGVAGSGIWSNLGSYASGQSPDASSATFLAQVVFFCIPIIMIWFTIGMASKSSLVGASVVVGLGYALPRAIGNYTKTKVVNTAKFAGNTAKSVAGGTARMVLPYDRLRGELAGVKESFTDGGKVFGKNIPKFMTAKGRKEAIEDKFAAGKGRVQREGGWSTAKESADAELRSLETDRARKAVKENIDKGVTATKHFETLKDGKSSGFDKRVAALSLAQMGEIRTANQLADSLDAVKGNADEFNQVLDKAKPSAVGSMDSTTNAKIIGMLGETKKDKDGKDVSVYGSRQTDLQQAYSGALKKENKAEYRIQAEIARRMTSGTGPIPVAQVYKDVLKMGSKDLSKQSGLIQSAQANGTDPEARAYFEEMAKNQKDAFDKVLRSDELKPEDMKVLLEIKDSVGTQTQQTAQRSQAWQNAQAAFNQPSSNTGQNGTGQQNP